MLGNRGSTRFAGKHFRIRSHKSIAKEPPIGHKNITDKDFNSSWPADAG